MKRFKLLLSFLAIFTFYSIFAEAQNRERSYYGNNISCSVGLVPYSFFEMFENYTFEEYSNDRFFDGSYHNFDKREFFRGDKYATPMFNLSFMHNFKRWFSVGATISYAHAHQNVYYINNSKKYSRRTQSIFAITPHIKFDWLKLGMFSLYSHVGFGLYIRYDKEKFTYGGDYMIIDNNVLPTIDLSLIGVSFGRRIFGFCDVNFSNIGMIKAGIGYKFN